jgi:hypothetical protein
MRDEDAEVRRRVDVDIVDSDRVLGDDAELRKSFEKRPVDTAAARRRAEKRVRAAGRREPRPQRGVGLRDDDVAAVVRERPMRGARLVDGTKDENLGFWRDQSFCSDS